MERPVRFWGANLAAYALFSTPRQNVAKQAHRMAQLGYNLMRIHHHDSDWVNPNIFDRQFKDSRHLNAKSLDALDWWIKCLKDEGIYVWIDAHVGRLLAPKDPVSLGVGEIKKHGNELKGFCYYNEDLQKLMIEFQHHYLDHVNKYTKLRYKDEPAVMGVLITNENDVTAHQGFVVLPDKNNPVHNALFTREYKAFARRSGLAEDRVFQIWLPGPGKLYSSDVEHRFNQTMIEDLRALGVKAPIATTNYWGDESLFSVPSLTDGDVIDVHSYGVSEAISTNPRSRGQFPAMDCRGAGLWQAAHHHRVERAISAGRSVHRSPLPGQHRGFARVGRADALQLLAGSPEHSRSARSMVHLFRSGADGRHARGGVGLPPRACEPGEDNVLLDAQSSLSSSTGP